MGGGDRVRNLSALAATLTGAESMDVGRQATGVGKKKNTASQKKGGGVGLSPP